MYVEQKSMTSSDQDDDIARRLQELRSGGERIATVGEIEERLARLRGVSVENIRHPSLIVLPGNKERKYDAVQNLLAEVKSEVELVEKVTPSCSTDSSASGKIFDTESTIRELKDITYMLKVAQQGIKNVSKWPVTDSKMENEMSELKKLTKQSSKQEELINVKLQQLWERMDSSATSSVEVDDTESLEDEIMEKAIEEAECEITDDAKCSKSPSKSKFTSFLSKLFFD